MKKNDGVSPVIGTILLVAITVVLVAIISAVVMGMAGGIGTSHVIGVTVVQGPDLDDTNKSLQVTITGGDTTGLIGVAVFRNSTFIDLLEFESVGVPMNFNGSVHPEASRLLAGPATIAVGGQFSDGNITLYTTKMNIV
ncbi:MAG TPA: type IV pilin N-terminal domain-containing protein [Methanocorpusculum sp.]|nr:type IV pilin N-terminal domain-containing protein [Methanocorpusculum sp.]